MGTWRAALIGCGNLGRTHAQQLQRLDGIRMVAFCDIDKQRGHAALAEFGGDYATDDPKVIFADDAVDVVYICTQHDTHAQFCIAAANAGKHIMIEKPLALTTEQCIAINQAVDRAGIKLMTAFKMRYYELLQKAKELIPNPLVVTMQMMDDRWAPDFWANDPVKGGGNVLSQGVHSCDIMRYVAGSDPLHVFAVGSNYYQPNGLVDNLAAVYQFANGVTGNLVQGDSGCPSLVSKFFLQIFAKDQSITLSDRFCTLVYQEKGAPPVTYRGTETGFFEENRAFLHALDNDLPAPIDHRDGLLATLMILQAFRSIQTQSPQPIAALLN
jgi:predicted dehydrogenase